MMRCPRDGYLVGATSDVPTDPTDHAIDGLPIIGCNRLRCLRCGVLVRSTVGLSLLAEPASIYDIPVLIASESGGPVVAGPSERRLYFCRCSHWEEDGVQPLEDEDPDSYRSSPDVPWRCDGHPAIALPHNIDGTVVWSQADLSALAERALHGEVPAQDGWLVRLHARLSPVDAAVVTATAMAGMEDADPRVRLCALRFFAHVSHAPACARLIELLTTRERALDEEIAWRVLEPLVTNDGPARELARACALGGRGTNSLFRALAAGDADWFLANGPQMARATPSQAEDLFNSFAQVPDAVMMGSARWCEVRDRVRRTIAEMISLDEALERTLHPLAAWDCNEVYRPRLCIYAARTWGAMLMKGAEVEPAELEVWNERARARLGRVGACHTHSEVVWMFEDENCGVWNSIRQLVRGNHQRLLLEGSYVATKEITQVISFVDATAKHVHRGVYCILAGGAQRRVHEEQDDDPPQGPDYSGEAVEWESAWVWSLGADLATWLGVRHTDREGRPTNTRALEVRSRILAFAHDLLSPPGRTECALGSYDGEDLLLRYDSHGGTVSLRITGSYGSRERVMKRGALPEITRYLRHFITPRRLLAAAHGGF